MILAGDIAIHTEHMDLLKQMAQMFEIPVLVIAGNHEHYTNPENPNHTWEGTIDDLRAAAHHTDKIVKGEVTFFEDSCAVYEGVRFVGATLWTDMKLYGDNPLVPMQIEGGLNDYRMIRKTDGGDLTAMDTMLRHGASRQYITDRLAEPFDGPTVVVTHHAPSWLSVHDMFRSSPISAAYASRLEPLMLSYEPALWIHGHTHFSFNYEIGKTTVVCNPRGYVGADLNEEFEPNLIIEIVAEGDQDE